MAGEPTPEEFAEQLGWIDDELAREGRDRTSFAVSGYWPVFVWPDAEEAWSVVRPYFQYMEWKYEDAEGAKGRIAELPSPPPMGPEEEAELRSTILCGTAEQVAERIAQLRDIAGGGFEFIGRLYFPGMSLQAITQSARLFAKDVIPRFRD